MTEFEVGSYVLAVLVHSAVLVVGVEGSTISNCYSYSFCFILTKLGTHDLWAHMQIVWYSRV